MDFAQEKPVRGTSMTRVRAKAGAETALAAVPDTHPVPPNAASALLPYYDGVKSHAHGKRRFARALANTLFDLSSASTVIW